jgi:hypothetical protein
MYKVIKELAGFKIGQTIDDSTIATMNLNKEIIDSWLEFGYIAEILEEVANKKTTDHSNANNSIPNSK